jgi:hypothetical protein
VVGHARSLLQFLVLLTTPDGDLESGRGFIRLGGAADSAVDSITQVEVGLQTAYHSLE